MAASVLWRWAVDADEMRREAAACRALARIVAPVSAARLLKAADEWDQLAQIADASRARLIRIKAVAPILARLAHH
jgi:hypothetical protein